ncbi:hypothetical protein CLAIMM_04959, partial [Cladophialophora immunda]
MSRSRAAWLATGLDSVAALNYFPNPEFVVGALLLANANHVGLMPAIGQRAAGEIWPRHWQTVKASVDLDDQWLRPRMGLPASYVIQGPQDGTDRQTDRQTDR